MDEWITLDLGGIERPEGRGRVHGKEGGVQRRRHLQEVPRLF